MTIYTVRYSAPAPISDELRRAFEAEALKVWQAMIEGRGVIMYTEAAPGAWHAIAGVTTPPAVGPVCACETSQEVILDPRD